MKIQTSWGIGDDPDWSPDGDNIVYSGSPGSTGSESQIWISDISGTSKKQLTHNTSVINRYSTWAPDGTSIAWTTDTSIWLMNADGTNQRELLGGFAAEPSWSPDSKQIVFKKLSPDKSKLILWKINIDGSGLRQLTH